MEYGMVMILTPETCGELDDESRQDTVQSLARVAQDALVGKLRDDKMLEYVKKNGARLELRLKDLTPEDTATLDKK